MRSIAAAATVLGFGSTVWAAIAKQCPTSDVCYSLNIPDPTASSGNGDIYFQISASSSYQWVALGQGSQMAGSNIFVMYTSGDGKNVTVSPRLGTGQVEPQHDTSAQITVLDGSGVSDGTMTANVKCSNCQSWSGGSMDFTSSSGGFIYAYKSGSALNSDDLSESISQHDSSGPFTLSLASAKGGSDVNPFNSSAVSSSAGSSTSAGSSGTATSTNIPSSCTPIGASLASPSGSNCPTAWPSQFSTAWPTARPTWAANCYPSGHSGSWPTGAPWGSNGGPPWGSDGPPSGNGPWNSNKKRQDDGCPAGYTSTSDSFHGSPFLENLNAQRRAQIAHGVLACLAFIAIFPTGAILVRLASFTGLVWVHAALQIIGYLIYLIAFGLGVFMATQLRLINNAHPIIGIVLFLVLLTQPLSGFIHHRLFKQHARRTFWSYTHLGIGRVAILLGMVNGGLGLQLAGNATQGQMIAYAVIAGIVALVYIAAIALGEARRRRNAPPSYTKSQSLALMDRSEEAVNREYYAKRGRSDHGM